MFEQEFDATEPLKISVFPTRKGKRHKPEGFRVANVVIDENEGSVTNEISEDGQSVTFTATDAAESGQVISGIIEATEPGAVDADLQAEFRLTLADLASDGIDLEKSENPSDGLDLESGGGEPGGVPSPETGGVEGGSGPAPTAPGGTATGGVPDPNAGLPPAPGTGPVQVPPASPTAPAPAAPRAPGGSGGRGGNRRQ